jgi:hypothetical protein
VFRLETLLGAGSHPTIPEAQAVLYGGAASRKQVEQQDEQRDHQQKVDQGAADVKAEAQKPQNKKNDENCPKHIRHTSLDCGRLRWVNPAQASTTCSQTAANWKQWLAPLHL